jgi:hypothetical protein
MSEAGPELVRVDLAQAGFLASTADHLENTGIREPSLLP